MILKIALHNHKFGLSNSVAFAFKVIVGIETKIFCLALSGVLTYILNLLFQIREITSQTIFVWFLISFALMTFAWRRLGQLLIYKNSDSHSSIVGESIFVLTFIATCVFAIRMSLNGSTFNSGDFSGFVRLVSQFTEFQGPWAIGANVFEFVTADRIQLSRMAGPPYPQATHFIVAMTDHLFSFNNLGRSSRVVTTTLVFVPIPFLLLLLGRTVNKRSTNSDLIAFSILFAILFQFDMTGGQVPAGISISLMLFLLIISLNQASLILEILNITLGAFLLLFVHPSSTASLILIYLLVKKIDLKQLKQLLLTTRYFRAVLWFSFLFVIVLVLYFCIATNIFNVSYPLLKVMFNSQTNFKFVFEVNFDLLARVIRIFFNYFLMFGDPSIENFFALVLLIFCLKAFRVNLRHRVDILEALIAMVLISSFVGGLPGLFGLAKILSLPWYSSPSRLVHLWALCIFFRNCIGADNKNMGSRYSTHLIFPIFALYIFHQIRL